MSLSLPLERVVLALCEDTNTARSLSVALLLKYREWDQLVSLTTDPMHYLDPASFFKDNSVSELLRKFPGFKIPGLDRKKVAVSTFYECEKRNALTNVSLNRFLQNDLSDPKEERWYQLIDSMRKEVKRILGPLPRGIVGKFGPGATLEDRGQLTTIPDKMSSRPTITKEARCLLPFWEETAWFRAILSCNSNMSDPKDVRGNRFVTVPKDAKKDRGICVEPSLNIFLQLGVGGVIRQRLKKAGIDLTTGQDLHRSLAQEGSLTGALSTIDLSNASDTVAFNFVKLLLPSEWFDLLSTLRSPFTFVDGRWVRLEKFSSMGNGYTFELETLLFLAIMSGLSNLKGLPFSIGKEIFAYGDDLILPSSISDDVVACLSFFGFSPNRRKTFLSGPFRESCGGDFFDGKPVRAHYLQEDPDEPHKIIAFTNGIKRMAETDHTLSISNTRTLRAWWRCLDMLPTHIRRLRGPVSAGDLVIHSHTDWCFRETPDRRGFVRVWSPVSRAIGLSHWKSDVVLASALYGVPSAGPIPRSAVSGYRERWMSVLERPQSSRVILAT